MDRPDHDRSPHPASGGISLQTLVIASAAAAAASYVVSRVWEPGTLISAAVTPVFIAIVSELLRKPVETVSATAKRVPVVQQVTIVRERATPPVDPGVTAVLEAEEEGPPASMRVRWGVIAATAAAAFVIVVGLFTVPDLIAGKSITGNGRGTTYFGGSSGSGSGSKSEPARTTTTKTVTTTAPGTVTTTAPAATTTVPAPTTTAPTTTAPTTTATTPADTTPQPTTATTPAPIVPVVP